ncbi:MAG: RyR domain-containing protein [Alsobacter sp.]
MSGFMNVLGWFRRNPLGLSGRWMAAMALVAIVGGWTGHFIQNLSAAQSVTPSTVLKLVFDSFVQTLQLFTLGASVPAGGSNWPLTVGRTMGAVVAGATVLALLGAAFRRDVTAWMVRRMTGHTILCGFGDRNRALALDIATRKAGGLVAVDAEPGRSTTDFCRAHDIRLLSGNAKEKETLRLANPGRAARAFVVTGDDERNLAVVRLLVELAEGAAGREPLAIGVAVDNLLLADRIATDPAFTRPASTRPIEITLFNMARLAGREVLGEGRFAEQAYRQGFPRIGLVMLGMSDTQEETLLQFLRLSPLPGLARPRIDLFVPDVEDALARLRRRSPRLAGLARIMGGPDRPEQAEWMADIVLHTLPPQALVPDDAMLEAAVHDAGGAGWSGCVVAFPRQDDTFLAATQLRESFARRRWSVPIHAHLPRENSLDPVLGEQGLPGYPAITPFGRLGRLCCLETFAGEREQRAKALHAFYRTRLDKDAAAASDWESLPESFRQSSRRAIDHLALKEIAARHFTGEARLDLACRRQPGLVEMLAASEHQSWRVERELDGWRAGPRRDDLARLHPDLAPYDDLPEAVKDANRDLVRRLASFRAESPASPEQSGDRADRERTQASERV